VDEQLTPGGAAIKFTPDQTVQMGVAWDLPTEPVQGERAQRPEDHEWDLVGTHSKPEEATTYFAWRCPRCTRRVITSTPSKDAPHFADQSLPDSSDVRRGRVPEDCRQALVEAVSDL
jgi:hypothetical protein